MMAQSIATQRRIPPRSKESYKPKPPFCSVEGVKSKAYEMLSRDAIWLLLEFYRKCDGYNRHCLFLTYKEVSGKISSGTFCKSVWELRAFGFLDVVMSGRLEKNASIYKLSDRWKKFENREKQLMRIKAILDRIEQVKRIKPPDGLDEEKKKAFKQRRACLVNKMRYRINGWA